MKILNNISNMKFHEMEVDNSIYTLLHLNENSIVAYKNGNNSNNEILLDLLENKAYATALLYLNENYELEVGKFKDIFKNNKITVNQYFKECEKLLNKNIKIVEESGIPLTNIKGYKIFETDRGILRGNGNKKIFESFSDSIDLNDITLEYLRTREFDSVIDGMSKCPECKYIFDTDENTVERDVDGVEPYSTFDEPYNERRVTYTVEYTTCPNCHYEAETDDFPSAWVDDIQDAPNAEELVPGISNLSETQDTATIEEDGTQCSDIAPKVDQDLGLTKTNKKYSDLLISDLDTNANNLINKGFLKNSKGQYQRGNYILVKEGNTYLAINKNKLKEDF